MKTQNYKVDIHPAKYCIRCFIICIPGIVVRPRRKDALPI